MLAQLLTRIQDGHGVRALVLVPTRELAVQVRDEFEKLAVGPNFDVSRCMVQPKSQIGPNPQVVVGTQEGFLTT